MRIVYKLIGKLPVPCSDIIEWAQWREKADVRVAETQVGPLWVSTVFLGTDHSFGRPGGAILFETMVFGGDQSSEFSDTYCERYRTWDEAEKGHAVAVEWAKQRLAEADASLGAKVSKESE